MQHINKQPVAHYIKEKAKSSLQSLLSKADPKISVLPPDETLIAYLNHLGKQYPFCVIFKCKLHDPL